MQLADNVMHFARVLRGAGLPVGPDRVVDSLRALDLVDIGHREDFYWTLASVFVDRREQLELYDQAFQLFWREPKMLDRVPALPRDAERNNGDVPRSASNDQSERLAPRQNDSGNDPEQQSEQALMFSERERLQRKDFDTMSADEWTQAKRLIAGLRLPIPDQLTRRLRPDARGRRIDLRASLRGAVRSGTEMIFLKRRSFEVRQPPLIVLCDISGSMSQYSRMLLYFMHAITNHRDRVHTFLFGTRLTNITRQLRHRDVDVAVAAASRAVVDWSGGTRIGTSLSSFNLRWSRRVLGQNAVVLLISDGLDRDAGPELSEAMQRLHHSCKKLIWLNPLLRYDGFQPVATGMRAMLPNVDAFLPAHNLSSLLDLVNALTQRPIASHRKKLISTI